MSHHVVGRSDGRAQGEEPADGGPSVFGVEESPGGPLSGEKAAGAEQGVGENQRVKDRRGPSSGWRWGGGGGALKKAFFN